MSNEQEVSRMFIRYMQQVLRNERINIYHRNLKRLKETPLEDWLLEEIVFTSSVRNSNPRFIAILPHKLWHQKHQISRSCTG